jgi:hypothetical protein
MEEDMAEDKTYLAFGNVKTALNCIDPNNNNYNLNVLFPEHDICHNFNCIIVSADFHIL